MGHPHYTIIALFTVLGTHGCPQEYVRARGLKGAAFGFFFPGKCWHLNSYYYQTSSFHMFSHSMTISDSLMLELKTNDPCYFYHLCKMYISF